MGYGGTPPYKPTSKIISNPMLEDANDVASESNPTKPIL